MENQNQQWPKYVGQIFNLSFEKSLFSSFIMAYFGLLLGNSILGFKYNL
jgi:hypothetical protein